MSGLRRLSVLSFDRRRPLSASIAPRHHALAVRTLHLPADDLRHCGITSEGPLFVVYVVKPNFANRALSIPAADTDSRARHLPAQDKLYRTEADDVGVKWRGREMRRLAQGDCTITRNIESLSTWINASRQWGSTTHAHGVQMDIKACLADEDIDTSALY